MFPIFYLVETERSRLYLRRFGEGTCPAMSGSHSYHNAKVLIGESAKESVCKDHHDPSDPRWPTQCACGYDFKDDDSWQLFTRRIYRRHDTNEEMILDDAPIGACWNNPWMTTRKTHPAFGIGEDGRCLSVRTPGGDWTIDVRANNCTLPHDQTHKCWVRHGRPEDGTLHVDKNGHSCSAGAGSIAMGSYHGFLHNGILSA